MGGCASSEGVKPAFAGSHGEPVLSEGRWMERSSLSRSWMCFNMWGQHRLCGDMGDLVGSALSPQAAAAEVNTSQTEDASAAGPSHVQLFLEILIVLMCVAAVTGTQPKLLFYIFQWLSFNITFLDNRQITKFYSLDMKILIMIMSNWLYLKNNL